MTSPIPKIVQIRATNDHLEMIGRFSESASALRVFECPPNVTAFSPAAGREIAVSSCVLQGDALTLSFSRYEGDRDRLYSAFFALGEEGGVVEGVRYVETLEEAALWGYPYPRSNTIKGLQVKMTQDALELGVGHAALNLSQPTIMRSEPSETTLTYRMDGRDFYFDSLYLEAFDERVRELSRHGIVVNLILLNSPKWDGREIEPAMREALLHPNYDPEGFISAFNMATEEGIAHYKAFVEFVAERYMRPDAQYGRACGLIVGNEVDSQWIWCNSGETPLEEYVRQYALALRLTHQAARKKYARARAYVSLDHLWTIPFKEEPLRYYRGRDILETLVVRCKAEGDFGWCLAYHPYPEDLFHANFWDDKTALPHFDTPRITFKNLEILSQFLSQERFLYGGALRPIILSEQGFHSEETEESETLQAAAYAYAYWKVKQTAGIESFILHAHVDHREEFDLNLGIWRRDKNSEDANAPGTPKPIHAIFRDVDGGRGEEIFAWAKGVVGAENWR